MPPSRYPLAGRVRRNPGDVNLTGLQLDDKEDAVSDESASGGHFDREEIGRGYSLPVRLDERLPRHPPLALRGGLDAVVRQDPLDRGRYQRRFVAGVTSPASSSSALRPSALPRTASRRR